MKLSSIVWVAMLIWVFEILFVSVMVRDEWLLANIETENSEQREFFGSKTSGYLDNETEDAFRFLFVDTGLRDMSYGLFIPTREQTDNTHYMQGIGAPIFRQIFKGLSTFWIAIYQVVMRFQTIMMWLPFLLLIIIPSIVDGLSIRAVKKATHTPTKVVRNRYGIYAILICLYLIVLSLFSPFPVGPLTHFFMMCVISMTISVVLANLHKNA